MELTEVLQAAPWLAIVWLIVAALRLLRTSGVFRDWSRVIESAVWVRRLRRLGASKKEIRKFLREYASRPTE